MYGIQQAEKKGVSPSQYGFVFGVFELTVFIVSFVYGKYVSGAIHCLIQD
jgi:hypothetical protein